MFKKIIPSVVFVVILTSFTCFAQSSLNIMSFNIRLNTTADGENQWLFRKDKVADMLNFYDVDICGMQEVLKGQLDDLDTLLPGFLYVGVGRDDGIAAGEFSPILYKKDKFQLIESQTFWLSLNPDVPGKSWDAALNRIVTWARFQPVSGEKEFYVFNTHFDHLGKEARKQSALLLLQKVKEIAGEKTAIITGDFNSTPEDTPIQILGEVLTDTKKISQSGHFGPDSTFNGFESKEIAGKRIDYIFVNQPGIKVLKHATLSNTWGGRFASDHHAVMAKIITN
jgi:endonuclease/exonuclease/phosphatase family metal-dependent hydrolase